MARKPRINYAGAWHHVGNRGVNKQSTYQDEVDRRTFLSILRDCLDDTGSELHAYCLMTNHYHLLIHTPEPSLSKLMQLTSSQYTRAYNSRHDRSGPLFTSRFWSSPITDDTALLEVSRYIHRNPLDISQSLPLCEYPWSSFGAFVGRRPTPRWLHTSMILQATSGSPKAYRRFVEQPDSPGTSSPEQEQQLNSDAQDAALLVAHEGHDIPSVELARMLGVTASSMRGKIRRLRVKAANDASFAELVGATSARLVSDPRRAVERAFGV